MRARATPPVALLLTLAVALALLGSCSSDKDEPPAGATLPPSSTKPTTTTTAADPFAIPKVIDEAYVNKVLAALNQLRGDAVRRIVSTGTIEFESVEFIRAIYNDPEYEIALKGLVDQRKRGLEAFKTPPGDRVSLVQEVVQVKGGCITVYVSVDFSQVVNSAPLREGEIQTITLRRTQDGADPKRLNRTGWSISFEEVRESGDTEITQECSG